MSRIEFKQVSKRFAPGLPWTIKDVELTIGQNEFCVFVGPSGCGKSTLLRMVAGLEDITSGDVLIDGERINDVPPARRGVAMVFQTYALYPHMTVAQNLGFGLRVAGMAPPEIDRKVRHAAEILQLTPLLDRLPKALSGGQRQRVAIGRAIVKEPQVFLFDEPLSNLDAALRVQTRLEIAKLHRDIGTASVIYVTHDQVEAMTLAQKIVLLHAGALVEQRGSIAQVGTPMDLYHRPASIFVAEFIGSPKMNMLPGTLVAPGDGRHAEVEFARQRVVVAADARRVNPGTAVHLGVRPEHVGIGEGGPGASLPAAVQHVERLGDHSLLYLDCAGAEGHLLVARVEGSDRPAKGSPVTAKLHAPWLHLFDGAGMACPRAGELPA